MELHANSFMTLSSEIQVVIHFHEFGREYPAFCDKRGTPAHKIRIPHIIAPVD
jgi:hypothetical protein